jgi:hypothetical protein
LLFHNLTSLKNGGFDPFQAIVIAETNGFRVSLRGKTQDGELTNKFKCASPNPLKMKVEFKCHKSYFTVAKTIIPDNLQGS